MRNFTKSFRFTKLVDKKVKEIDGYKVHWVSSVLPITLVKLDLRGFRDAEKWQPSLKLALKWLSCSMPEISYHYRAKASTTKTDDFVIKNRSSKFRASPIIRPPISCRFAVLSIFVTYSYRCCGLTSLNGGRREAEKTTTLRPTRSSPATWMTRRRAMSWYSRSRDSCTATS